VAAHLDEQRRRQLFDVVRALGGQAWYAGTDAATFAPLGTDIEILAIDHARRQSGEGGFGAGSTEGAVVNG
jgi:recombinational DNA repair ATPase RecF